ncbi:MAG: hypothetical protein ACREKL_05065 [Chthoniobacterales bacterium]
MKTGRLLVASILLGSFSPLLAATYNITDLGTLGGSQSAAYGINASGQVVGSAYLTGNTANAGTLFSTSGNIEIGNFGGINVNEARGINSSGAVVGINALPGDTSTHAFIYLGGATVNLGTLGGTSSRAYAINDSGQITGESQITGDTAVHAYRYKNGAFTDLGGTTATGFAINAAGHVVGRSNFKAFIATGNTVVNISGIGTGNMHTAYGINDNDQVVGTSNIASGSGTFHAFLYQSGSAADIGSLVVGNNATAYAINNSSVIVGTSNLTPGGVTYHAFIYQGGQITDLNSLIPANTGWVLETAYAINASGLIAGSGTLNGVKRAFLLTSTDLDPGNETQPPRIYVNGAKRLSTTRAKLKLTGSSGGNVNEVRYRLNGRGAYRSTHGDVSGWKITVALKPGKNLFQVIAVSSAGVKSLPAKVIITRTDG